MYRLWCYNESIIKRGIIITEGRKFAKCSKHYFTQKTASQLNFRRAPPGQIYLILLFFLACMRRVVEK